MALLFKTLSREKKDFLFFGLLGNSEIFSGESLLAVVALLVASCCLFWFI